MKDNTQTAEQRAMAALEETLAKVKERGEQYKRKGWKLSFIDRTIIRAIHAAKNGLTTAVEAQRLVMQAEASRRSLRSSRGGSSPW